jgi:hypothetical protein
VLVSSAVRPVTNLFWVLYFKLLPSVGLLYAAFIPKAGEVKREDRGWAREGLPIMRTLGNLVNRGNLPLAGRGKLPKRILHAKHPLGTLQSPPGEIYQWVRQPPHR